MNIKNIMDDARKRLCEVFSEDQARALSRTLCTDVLHLPSHTAITDPSTEVSEDLCQSFDAAVERLCTGEPLQYVLGQAEFCSRRFKVGPGVLIPRPETEQLCLETIDHAEKMWGRSHEQNSGQNSSDSRFEGLRILDLCTGSGCIAWTLALSLPGAVVVGVDISDKALSFATYQHPWVDEIRAMVDAGKICKGKSGWKMPLFMKYDILQGPQGFPFGKDGIPSSFDIIVSNPPYVMDHEKALMQANVLDHEPSLALFVPDEDPLVFYRAIASFAGSCLCAEGFGMVEINEALPQETGAVFAQSGFSKVVSSNDFRDKPRFCRFSY